MKFAAPLVFCIAALSGCANNPAASQAATAIYDEKALPPGAPGEAIRYGRELILNTRAHMRGYVVANMDCAACHVAAGTQPKGGSFVGIYGQFPQWNTRAHRMIALQDRLAECFLYSMNGKPPAYNSREMVAMVAYIAYLSRGTRVGATPDPAVKLTKFAPPAPASASRGAVLYSQRCAACHGASGAGGPTFPPLWGETSFNSGAGMHRLWTMAAFVRSNMPQNAPGTLSAQQAYDVSAYVLSHTRPRFQGPRPVTFPPRPAKYF
jgi:thiosulfate dehydrogenase